MIFKGYALAKPFFKNGRKVFDNFKVNIVPYNCGFNMFRVFRKGR